MKLRFKEDPKEWRKAALLSLIGPSLLIGIFRWRGVVSWKFVFAALALFVVIALCALVRPRWFRGFYRFGTWLGFHTIQIFGKVVLALVFFLFLTPFGLIMRLMGKDSLQLKPPRDQQTFWRPAKQDGSLDNMY